MVRSVLQVTAVTLPVVPVVPVPAYHPGMDSGIDRRLTGPSSTV
ncbi:hypothetical protein [Kitasatospora sp. NPDC059803]